MHAFNIDHPHPSIADLIGVSSIEQQQQATGADNRVDFFDHAVTWALRDRFPQHNGSRTFLDFLYRSRLKRHGLTSYSTALTEPMLQSQCQSALRHRRKVQIYQR